MNYSNPVKYTVMNYLAHLFLSGDSESIQLGNFIGDWIKGKAYKQYPADIQRGILLHRAIDHFTDNHPITHSWSRQLQNHYHKYAGVVVDIFYDHFLSLQWDDFSGIPHQEFIDKVYKRLKKNIAMLPYKAQEALYHIIINKRLESYSKPEGIFSVLKTMSIYTSLPPYPEFAMEVLKQNYETYASDFKIFMLEIMHFIAKNYGIYELNNQNAGRLAL